MNSGIYLITCLVNNKKYVGQAKDVNRRLRGTLFLLRNRRYHNRYLQRAFDKYGEELFSFSVLEECSEDLLDEKEIYYIKFYKTTNQKYGYNDLLGGNKNRTLSERTKMRISLAHKGKVGPNLGKKFSDEHKARISRGKMGSIPWNKGMKMPPSFGAKLSKVLKGNLNLINAIRNAKPRRRK